MTFHKPFWNHESITQAVLTPYRHKTVGCQIIPSIKDVLGSRTHHHLKMDIGYQYHCTILLVGITKYNFLDGLQTIGSSAFTPNVHIGPHIVLLEHTSLGSLKTCLKSWLKTYFFFQMVISILLNITQISVKQLKSRLCSIMCFTCK